MRNKPYKIHVWYTKSGKEFRKELLSWVSDGTRGGEIGSLLRQFVVQGSPISNLMGKIIRSKTGRAVAIALVITSAGLLVKKNARTPWYETIFDNLESIALGTAGIIFLLEINDRQKRDHYEAWQVINSAMGQPGNGGRTQALEDLNKDGVVLEGVDVSKADLSGINLRGANLVRANFIETQLDEANLAGANLDYALLEYTKLMKANLAETDLACANLKGAQLSGANLTGAILFGANLAGANLSRVNLEKADLSEANLAGANLLGTNLRDAILIDTNLKGANLLGTNLEGANLRNANLEGTKLIIANLKGTQKLTQEQLSVAKICFTTLPETIKIELDRDCIDLGINPESVNYSPSNESQ
jgi:uncharacterized protein YjbI with pentapeptide repeats